MSGERRVLASCIKSRDAFDRLAAHLVPGDFTEQGQLLLEHLRTYYNRDAQATMAEPALLIAAICRDLPNPKHQKAFTDLVLGLGALETSPPNVVADYLASKREKTGNELAGLLLSGKDPQTVRGVLDKYSELLAADDLVQPEAEVLTGKSVIELAAARVKPGNLIKLLPRALNERLDGGLLRRHHVIVFARPEVGKTAFVVNAMSGFVRQGLRTLYIGNEDPIEDVVLRTVCRLADMTKAEVLNDPARADAAARALGYDNMVFAPVVPGTIREIDALVRAHTPDVVVVDQLRNLMVGMENFTRDLDKAAQGVRAIGRRHNALMVSVTQAGDSASGKSILDMGDVDSSNTGIPAACDLMVGIGMSQEDERLGRRCLSLPKNKPGGVHDSFLVRVDLAKSKVVSG